MKTSEEGINAKLFVGADLIVWAAIKDMVVDIMAISILN